MSAICLSIQSGAASRSFPDALAKRLGAPLADYRRLEFQLAEQCVGHTEFIPRLVDGKSRNLPEWGIRIDQLACLLREEIFQTASLDPVIVVGWVAPMLLRGCAAIPSIEVWAPLDQRARCICSTHAFNHLDTALLEIESTEAFLGDFSRKLFHADWRDAPVFDFSADAAMNSENELSELIASFLWQRGPQSEPARLEHANRVADWERATRMSTPESGATRNPSN